MFAEWLAQQTERKDDVGKFARIAWDDFTSGCARWYSGAIEWRDHIMKAHPDKQEELFSLLKEAFVAYAADNGFFRS